jgi:hypothetical protein
MAKLENWWVEGLSEIIFKILGASLEISGLWVDFKKSGGAYIQNGEDFWNSGIIFEWQNLLTGSTVRRPSRSMGGDGLGSFPFRVVVIWALGFGLNDYE